MQSSSESVQISIAQYLILNELLQLQVLNKYWFHLISEKNPSVWCYIKFNYNKIPNTSYLYKKDHVSIYRLIIDKITDELIWIQLNKFSKLTHLTIFINNSDLIHYNNLIQSDSSSTNCLASLTYLKIEFESDQCLSALNSILFHSIHLKELCLNLYGDDRTTEIDEYFEESWFQSLVQNYKQLKILRLPLLLVLTEEIIMLLLDNLELEELFVRVYGDALVGLKLPYDKYCKILAAHPKSKSLTKIYLNHISDFNPITTESIQNLLNINNNFMNVSTLSLENCGKELSIEALKELPNLSNLTFLSLINCASLAFGQWSKLDIKLVKIKSLKISFVSDWEIVSLVKTFPNIQSVLCVWSHLSTSGLLLILNNLKYLNELALGDSGIAEKLSEYRQLIKETFKNLPINQMDPVLQLNDENYNNIIPVSENQNLFNSETGLFQIMPDNLYTNYFHEYIIIAWHYYSCYDIRTNEFIETGEHSQYLLRPLKDYRLQCFHQTLYKFVTKKFPKAKTFPQGTSKVIDINITKLSF